MIQFSPNVSAVLASGVIESFYMFRILNRKDEGLLYATTTFYADINLKRNGVADPMHHYPANGGLISADAPQVTTNVDREQYKVVIADEDLVLRPQLEIGMVGLKLECRVGFVKDSKPLLDIADAPIVYSGRIDGASLVIDTSSFGGIQVQITGSSPMRNLDMKRGIFMTKDKVRMRLPTDSCADQIYEGSTGLNLKWGKA
jgi:hypothetical protein